MDAPSYVIYYVYKTFIISTIVDTSRTLLAMAGL